MWVMVPRRSQPNVVNSPNQWPQDRCCLIKLIGMAVS